jgi:flagellin
MVGINTNIAAKNAQANLSAANFTVSSSVSKLSSGNRIVKASDDVAALSIGTSLASTVSALKVAKLNAGQAKTVLDIADGALAQIGNILQRQKALGVQSNSGSLSDTERGYLNQEFQALTEQINSIVENTSFNGITLLNGSIASSSSLSLEAANGDTATIAYTTTGTYGTGVSALAVADSAGTADDNIVGELTDVAITGEYTSANGAVFALNFNGSTYTADVSNISTATSIAFTNQTTGTTVTLTVTANGNTAAANQTVIDTVASTWQNAIDGLSVYQRRVISDASDGIESTQADGTLLAGLTGANIEISGTFAGFATGDVPTIGQFTVVGETTNTDGQISVVLNGQTYRTVSGEFNSNATDLGGATLDGGTGIIRLFLDGDNTNTNDYVDIDVSTTDLGDNSIDIDSDEGAALLQSGLNQLIGAGYSGGLSFQVGAEVTDTIAVSINSIQTSQIYTNDSGIAQSSVSIDTSANAIDAVTFVSNAIETVISARAGVGALQSRFNYAEANLDVAISNSDAARGSFLDADISDESTAFASAQVKLQASVAVLAQANALPRNLLQLLQG